MHIYTAKNGLKMAIFSCLLAEDQTLMTGIHRNFDLVTVSQTERENFENLCDISTQKSRESIDVALSHLKRFIL